MDLNSLLLDGKFVRSRNRHTLRIATSFPLARRRTSLGLVIRISLFNAYLFVYVPLP